MKLINQRSLETLKEKWWHQNPKRQECQTAEDDSTGISIQNIGGVFIVILAGILLSLVILLFEFLYYKKKEVNGQKETANGKTGPTESANNNSTGDLSLTSSESVLNHRRNGNVVHYTNSAFQF
jgi:ionotropic glutamate receptor